MKAGKGAVLAVGVLLACACAAQPQQAERRPPSRPEQLCPEVTQAAIAAYRAGRFGRLERLDTSLDGAPPAAHPVERKHKLDGVFEALYLDCGKKTAYIERRGGVADITYWFGPFALD